MKTPRPFPNLALALTLALLASGLGGACPPVVGEGDCYCLNEDATAPADVSGDVYFAAPDLNATFESVERSTSAVADASAQPTPAPKTPASSVLPPRTSPSAASTPLFLSHCAFLC